MSAVATLPYSDVRALLLDRRGYSEADIAGALPLVDAAVARYITTAYRRCYTAAAWPFALTDELVDCTGGLVAWADIGMAKSGAARSFWSADPRPATSTAYELAERFADGDGVWLETSQAEVWARYRAQPAIFTAASTTDPLLFELVDATVYFALADWLGNKTQEREQKNDALRDGERLLDELFLSL